MKSLHSLFAILPLLVSTASLAESGLAVWRPSNGTWYIKFPKTNETIIKQFGHPLDMPMTGDYDADGKDDFVVFRHPTGTWYIETSGTKESLEIKWGALGDMPIPDWTRFFPDELAVVRPSNPPRIYRKNIRTGVESTFDKAGPADSIPFVAKPYYDSRLLNYGYFWKNSFYYVTSEGPVMKNSRYMDKRNIPIIGDFDGDGLTNRATYTPDLQRVTIWDMYRQPELFDFSVGGLKDVPIGADYNGDGKDDVALFRPSDGTWRIITNMFSNATEDYQWGQEGDIPVRFKR